MNKNTERILRKAGLLLAGIVLALSITIFVTCDMPNDTKGNTDNPGGPPTVALRAEPAPASTNGVPKVFYAVTDGKENIYALDVGYIGHIYVATTAGPYIYDGTSTLTLTATTFNEVTITETLTESMAESVTVTNTNETTH